MIARMLPLMLAVCLSGCAANPIESQQRLHHLVVVWLNKPGDESLRQRYIDESKPLAELPGVLAYDVGRPARVKRRHSRSVLDESYDVAIASVFENQAAFEAFLKNPTYGRIAKDVLRPMVEKYQVYDFVE
ncbi:Dabb family protein [Methylomonas methanica]|uniref:Stress responsive alpha-beta barrel domain-containing protein n=1 Tax=Methylomonas methanica (strain DSM 25384 / MC09) TaxID=857087 RepID=G0A145_METMM|nr:Dabb family protein [Methylomonas methanica]AEG01301.1 Stress responsive alpha-beta barrel domain-containing protein [Methylomonas methanica MC09]